MLFSELEFSSICAAVLCARTGGKTLDNFTFFLYSPVPREKAIYVQMGRQHDCLSIQPEQERCRGLGDTSSSYETGKIYGNYWNMKKT